MNILALESTAKVASVAITQDERLRVLYQCDSGRTQSEVLLPMIEHALNTLSLTVDNIDLIAVTAGPGSFTGVRIGVATAKGLAFGKDIPCIGVSTLASLADNLRELDGVICPVMDARRSQVYNALFRAKEGALTRLCDDRAIGIDALLDELSALDDPIYIVGDGYELVRSAAVARGIDICVTPPMLREENAYACARVAFEAYQNGEGCTDRTLSPVYLRLPQAERERLERLQTEQQATTNI